MSTGLMLSFCLLMASAQAQNFRVDGKRILDPNGNEFIPKGANVGLWSEQTSADNVNFFKNHWRFNTLRVFTKLKLKDDGAPADPNNYPSDAFCDRYVNAYTVSTNGPKAVVMFEAHDFSGSYYSATSNPSLTDLVNFWKRMAQRYKNNPYVWFNIMNEPGYQGNVTTQYYDMHKTVIQAIRAEGANNIIVVDGYSFASEDGENKAINVPDAKSGILTYGPTLLADDPAHNLVFSFHMYDAWKPAGVPKLADYIDRVQARNLAVMVGEFSMGNAGAGWDVTEAAITMFNTVKFRRVGWLFWHWNTGDNTRLTTTYASGLGIDKTDGNRPTNLTWAGEQMWDDTHGITRNLGVSLNRHGWVVSASNASASYPVGRTVDGDFNSGYASGANMTPGMWFQIDLGSAKAFNRLVLANAGDDGQFLRGYKILVSNDASNWTQVATGSNAMGDLNVAFSGQNARYIRVENTATASRWWGIREVFVYTSGNEPQFIDDYYRLDESKALSRTGWTASASDVGEAAANALDGNIYSRYTTGKVPTAGMTFTVDMKSPQTFNKILVHTGTSDAVVPYRIYVSNDGANWGNPVTGSQWNNYAYSVGGCYSDYVSFPAQTARYIKLEVTAGRGGVWWSIHDFKVYNLGDPAAIQANAIYELIPQCYGCGSKRLDVAGGTGPSVQIYQTNNLSPQRWKMINISGQIYELQPQSVTASRLDAANGVTIATANSGNSQRWKLTAVDITNGIYELEPQSATGTSLDVATGPDGNKGPDVQIYNTNHSGSQRWKFVKVSSGARQSYEQANAEVGQLQVFPNPARYDFTLESQLELAEVQLLNSLGKPTYSRENIHARTVHIYLKGQQTGVYLVKARTVQGSLVTTRVVVTR